MKRKEIEAALKETPWLVHVLHTLTSSHDHVVKPGWKLHAIQWAERNVSEIIKRPYKDIGDDFLSSTQIKELIRLPIIERLTDKFAFCRTTIHLWNGYRLWQFPHENYAGRILYSLISTLSRQCFPMLAFAHIVQLGIEGRCSSTEIYIVDIPKDSILSRPPITT